MNFSTLWLKVQHEDFILQRVLLVRKACLLKGSEGTCQCKFTGKNS